MAHDHRWLEGLWHRNAGRIYAYAARRVGRDVADDVVADTFVVAWRNRDNRPRRELPWLYGVARKVIGDRYRSQARSDRLAQWIAAQPYGEQEPSDGQIALFGAAERLGDEDREILMLAGWEGLSSAEAGEVLGITASSFRMKLSRARKRLTRELGSDG